MIPERGTSKNTLSTYPTREFRFILDPQSITLFTQAPFLPVFKLIRELEDVHPHIEIKIYLQIHLCEQAELVQGEIMGLEAIEIPELIPDISFELESSIKDVFKKTGNDENALNLLSISEMWQADGVITGNESLIDQRYAIFQHHRIRIILLNEFADIVEIIAHGNSIFRSTTSTNRLLNFDLYYQLTHWKAVRYFKWCSSIMIKISETELVDNLRSAFFNRYPYILYSRDMIRFYELQRDFYSRRGLYQSFGLAIGFYVNTYAFLLWGMLDQLTVIAKYKTELELDEKDCGIRNPKFWKNFRSYEPELADFIKSDSISKWINVLADMRHHASHKTIKIPVPIVSEAEGPEKTDEEILEIIKQEHAEMYKVFPELYMKEIEPTMIANWRAKNLKMIAPSMVFIKKRNGTGYFRDPVVDVDYDLNMLTAIIDAFLVKLFNNMYET